MGGAVDGVWATSGIAEQNTAIGTIVRILNVAAMIK
jgi:hypothetical protein